MTDLEQYSMAALKQIIDEAELRVEPLGVPLPPRIEEKYSAFLAVTRSEQARSFARGNVDPEARAATLRSWAALKEALSAPTRCGGCDVLFPSSEMKPVVEFQMLPRAQGQQTNETRRIAFYCNKCASREYPKDGSAT